MPRGGEDSHAPQANPRELGPWQRGMPGKFLIDASGQFYAWRTADDRAPHHAAVAHHLGISSWPLDGIVNPDGTLEPTARAPGIDIADLLRRVLPQAEALGIRVAPR